ncbi:MAG: hypothetical protein Q9209_003822 [Squamulea sp. 1 TL-2023]
MDKLRSIKGELKEKLRRLERPATTQHERETRQATLQERMQAQEEPFDKYSRIHTLFGSEACNFIHTLKLFYSDTSYESLTEALNIWHKDHFTVEEVKACHEDWIKFLQYYEPETYERRADLLVTDAAADRPTHLGYHSLIEEDESRCNDEIHKLAQYRRKYDAALAKIKNSEIPPWISATDKSAEVERLKSPRPINVKDLRDLTPADLEQVYEARDRNWRELLSNGKKRYE